MHAVGRVFFIVMLSVVTLHSSNSVASALDSPKERIEPLHKEEKGATDISGSIGLQPFNAENYENKHVDDMENVLKRRRLDSEIPAQVQVQSGAGRVRKYPGVTTKVMDGTADSLSKPDVSSQEDEEEADMLDRSKNENKDYNVPIVGSDDNRGYRSTGFRDNKHRVFRGKRRPVDPLLELEEYGEENSHLPSFQTMEELYKNAFYCVASNDLPGLMAVLRAVTLTGDSVKYVLEDLRTKDGDNLLIHAVKNNALDVVRYLLTLGVDIDVKNKSGDTPLSIAISTGNTEIINAIAEIKVQYNIGEEEDGKAQS